MKQGYYLFSVKRYCNKIHRSDGEGSISLELNKYILLSGCFSFLKV